MVAQYNMDTSQIEWGILFRIILIFYRKPSRKQKSLNDFLKNVVISHHDNLYDQMTLTVI